MFKIPKFMAVIGAIIPFLIAGVKFYDSELRCFVGLDNCQSLQRSLLIQNHCQIPVRVYLKYRNDDGNWKKQGWLVSSNTNIKLSDPNGEKLIIGKGYYYYKITALGKGHPPLQKSSKTIPFPQDLKNMQRADIYNKFLDLFKSTTAITLNCKS